MLRVILCGIDLVKSQKANLKQLFEVKQYHKRHKEYIAKKWEAKAKDGTSYLLKLLFDTQERCEQEFENRLCVLDQNKRDFYFKQRKIFNMKPAKPEQRRKKHKKRSRSECGKPSTYFPYRCNVATILHAIERVDETYLKYEQENFDFDMIKKLEKAFSHFLCVITDILVRIDPEKVPKEAYLASKYEWKSK